MTTDRTVDFDHFHQQLLPALLRSGRDALLRGHMAALKPICFRLREDGRAYSYLPVSQGVDIRAGVQAEVVVEIDQPSWQGLVEDVESAPGLLYSGRVSAGGSGSLMEFVHWEPVLRAMFHGLPIYDPATFVLRDTAGSPLDPAQAFALDDSERARAFLDAAGYVLIRNVFSASEIAHLREEAEQLRSAAREGDQTSWWGRDAAGRSVLCRVIKAGDRVLMGGLYDDSRIQRIAALLPDTLGARRAEEVDGVTVIYKNPAMKEGLSDLPWHRDCGMGGHAVMCPAVILSLYLFDASEEAGSLHFLPGSHRMSWGAGDSGSPPQGVRVDARAGDVTLHYTDVMHAAPPPTGAGPFRQSVLLVFDRCDFVHHRGDRHYNDVLLGATDGQVQRLDAVVAANDR